jgi:hypothetical protein
MSTVTMSDCGTKITVTRSTPTKSVFQYLYSDDYPNIVVKFPGDDFILAGHCCVSTTVVQQGMEDTLTEILDKVGIKYD